MKNFLSRVLICGFFLLMTSIAQAGSYAYRSAPFAFDTPSASATTVTWAGLCTGYPGGDDDYAIVNFPAGFTFAFNGTTYSQVRILSNGMIQFGADAGFHRDYTSQALPITTVANPGPPSGGCASAVPANLLLVYWLDINTQPNIANAPVQYELLGTAPSRRFAITWRNVALYGNNATRYTFQVVLNEDGTFRYQYTTGVSTGAGATVGVQVSTTDTTQFAYNQTFIDPTNGTSLLWYPASQSPPKQAEYRMDEGTWNGTAGEVHDLSGFSRNGVRVGNTTTVLPNSPYNYCRAGNIPLNTSAAIQDAISVPLTPQSLGNAGSFSFWYRGNAAWNDGNVRMLVDATTQAITPFFLAKLGTGQIRLTIADSANVVQQLNSTTSYTFAAGTWHHIAASWSLQGGVNQTVLQLFVDGQPAGFLRSSSTGSWPTVSGVYQNFYLGDNRTAGVTPLNGSGNSANGYLDEFAIYDFDISQPQAYIDYTTPARATCTTFDHFLISNSGSGATCQPENVTITAHDNGHSPVTLAGTTMTLSTSTNHGDWSVVTGNNLITNNGNGSATYVFANESAVTLGLRDTFAETLSVNVNSGGITENTNSFANHDPSLTFSHQVFRFVTSSLVEANPITGKRSGKDSSVAPEGQSLFLQAIKTDLSTFACTAAFPASATPVNIDMVFQCQNPATCSAGQNATITNSAGTTTANVTLAAAAPATPASYTAVPLIFAANAMASLRFNYPDAGQIRMQARYQLPLANGTGSGNFMSGASQPFVVAPAAFAFSNLPSGTIKAGQNFSATVTAVNAYSTPAATPNFGRESSPETVALTHTLVQPTGSAAQAGTISTPGFTAISNGATTATLNWSDVGNITLNAALSDGNYLGSGLNVTGTSATIGRFIPDHFDTVVTHGCNAAGFTYSSQPMTVRINVMNGRTPATATLNYDGSVNTSPNFSRAVTLSDGNAAGAGTLSNSAVAASVFGAGVATVNTPAYTFTTRQTVATGIRLRAIDTDAVTSSGFTEGTTEIRAGRVRLQNAHGSELLDLPMAMQVQNWNGSAWVTHSADTCTGDATLGAANAVSITLAATSPATLATSATCVQDTGTPGRSNAGCSSAAISARQFREGATPSVGFAGDFNLWLRAPNASGAIDVRSTVPSWLQYNWGGVVSSPVGRATFGIYKGGPVIFGREVY